MNISSEKNTLKISGESTGRAQSSAVGPRVLGLGDSWSGLAVVPLISQSDRRSYEKAKFHLTTALSGAWEFAWLIIRI